MRFFLAYLRERRRLIALFAACAALFAAAFALFHLPMEAVLYPTLLCAALLLFAAARDCARAQRKRAALRALLRLPEDLSEELARFDGLDDTDYRALVEALEERGRELALRGERQRRDMLDYYTVWAHQIKTPIAAMRLTLQNEDSALSRGLTEELGRVEQYVEMVLCYQRLESESTDYVFREIELDTVVRQAVRRFAAQFIRRGLSLRYEALGCRVVSDEKWLLFVVEQVLSNALKYTDAGGIEIFREGEATLCIRDTGIGIAPEDLPRIFEKGYTGSNGRADKRASGLGLYLCRRVCGNLGHGLSAESAVGVGTTVRLDLAQRRERPE